ncbi:MAG: diacylglycerol kinase family protein [Hyphomicrobiaceae bacterium]
MRARVLINAKAGAILGLDKAQVETDVAQIFHTHGHSALVSCVPADHLATELEIAAQDPGYNTLIIGGGDGSVRLAAKYAMENAKTLGILPLGTMNLLAKDLNMPLDLHAAASALCSGEVRLVDVASVNGNIYLCNSMMGLPPKFAARRQSLRGRPLLERIAGYFDILRRMLASRAQLTISLEDGAQERKLRVMSVAVANNSYADTAQFGLSRPRLDEGHLTVYASRHTSGWDLAMGFARALFGSWKGDPMISQFTAERFTLRTSAHRVKLSNDGEVEDFQTPLRYEIRARALKLLVPA